MRITAKDISVIIPVGPDEDQWRSLVGDLKKCSSDLEIILERGVGRGNQMNAGAKKSKRSFVWFLHADSRVEPSDFKALLKSLESNLEGLHYFDLVFLQDGPQLMFLNSIGCYFRSKYLGMPWGDQGFCVKRESFLELGGFPHAKYGEDHLFVWKWRQKSRHLVRVDGTIFTSARKYKKKGWLKTTLKHLVLGFTQAFPEWIKRKHGAIAIFVKTAKYSPIKTRLAKDTTEDFAVRLHELSTECIRTEVAKLDDVTPYWAVAEKNAIYDWQGFAAIYQGPGDLGKRLNHVYSTLLKKYGFVLLVGADCPELDSKTMSAAIKSLEEFPFVIGPAKDGGFYLFGGKVEIPAEIWSSVEYSVDTTEMKLTKLLKPIGEVARLRPISDIDNIDDARNVSLNMRSHAGKSEAQTRLLKHLNQLLM